MRHSRSEGVRKIFFFLFSFFFLIDVFDWFRFFSSWVMDLPLCIYVMNYLFVLLLSLLYALAEFLFILWDMYFFFFFFFFWKARMCCSISQYIDSLIKSFFIVKKNITLYSSFAQKSNLLLHLSIV